MLAREDKEIVDREAWRAAVRRVTKSRTQLSDWTTAMEDMDANKISQEIRWDTPVTEPALTRVAMHGPDFISKVRVHVQCGEQGSQAPQGSVQARASHEADPHCKVHGWCLEPWIIFSFLSEFLTTLRKVGLALARKFTQGRKTDA